MRLLESLGVTLCRLVCDIHVIVGRLYLVQLLFFYHVRDCILLLLDLFGAVNHSDGDHKQPHRDDDPKHDISKYNGSRPPTFFDCDFELLGINTVLLYRV